MISPKILSRAAAPAVALILALAAFGTLDVLAQDKTQELALRFPQPRITPQQWAAFRAEVMALPDAEIIVRPDAPDVTVIAVPRDYTIYYFTERGQAHPAVIVAEVVSRNGAVAVHHSGYFAGSEAAFSRWLLAMSSQAEQLNHSLEMQSPGQP
jgi:hypothetical protein